MTESDILRALRDAGRRADEAPPPDPYGEPLGELFAARVAKQVLAEQRGAGGRAQTRASRRAPILATIGAAIALAAGGVLWMRPPRGPSVDLPSYSLNVVGGSEDERSAAVVETTTARAHADAPLRLVLRPSVDVAAKLKVAVVADRGGALNTITPDVRIFPSGAVQVRGRAGDLVGSAPGESTIVVIVAPEQTSIDAIDIAKGAAAPKGVAVARARVTIVP